MSVKEEVIRLVEALPESDLVTVHRILRGLALTGGPDEQAFQAFLDQCPYDDEPETPEDRAAVEAGWEEYRRGNVIPHDEVVGRRPRSAG